MLPWLLDLIIIEQFGFTWWLCVAAVCGAISYELGREYEYNGYERIAAPRDVNFVRPTILILLFAGVWVYSGYSLDFFKEHYISIIIALTSYPIIGVIWTFIYWRIYFVPQYVKTMYEPVKIKWLKSNNASNLDNKVPEELVEKFREYLMSETQLWHHEVSSDNKLNKVICITPQAKKYIARICATGIWWPISMINYLFMRFMHDAVIAIFNAMKGKLDQISANYSTKYNQDFGAK